MSSGHGRSTKEIDVHLPSERQELIVEQANFYQSLEMKQSKSKRRD
ncbi:hypothetical protein [Petralouisia muris]|nr:hypothetical protein [Petralouisia muris]